MPNTLNANIKPRVYQPPGHYSGLSQTETLSFLLVKEKRKVPIIFIVKN